MADTAHAAEHEHGDHVMSVKQLIGTWAALMVLTAATVGATLVDFGSQINFAIAMVVAVAKATIVAAIFMHLLYDRRYNLLIFITSILAVFLFVSITLNDVSSYQDDLVAREADAPFSVPGLNADGKETGVSHGSEENHGSDAKEHH